MGFRLAPDRPYKPGKPSFLDSICIKFTARAISVVIRPVRLPAPAGDPSFPARAELHQALSRGSSPTLRPWAPGLHRRGGSVFTLALAGRTCCYQLADGA